MFSSKQGSLVNCWCKTVAFDCIRGLVKGGYCWVSSHWACSAKGVLDNVGVELITGKPIKIDIVGNMNVEFASVSREVEFNVRDYVVSQNLADEVGIGKPIDKVKGILEDIGIKF